MAYSNSPNLQNSANDSNPHINPPSGNPTQDANQFAINQASNNLMVYAVGPDGMPNPTNLVVYTVAENGMPVISNNPPATIATGVPSPPSPPSPPRHFTEEFYFAIFASMVVITGFLLFGATDFFFLGLCVLAFGTVLLIGVGCFACYKNRRQKYQTQLQIYQQQMRQMQQAQVYSI